MAYPERNGVAGLRIETSFGQRSGWQDERRRSTTDGDGIESDRTKTSQDYNARRRDTDEERSVLSDLHSATPPISVPRPDGRSAGGDEFPHKPSDIQGSPLDNYLQSRRTSITFNPKVSLDTGREEPLGEPLPKDDVNNRPPQRFESRTSGLRNALSQDDDHHPQAPQSWRWDSNQSPEQQSSPAGPSRAQPVLRPDDESITGTEIDHPTSLTSLSTASPVPEEVRTPPGSAKDDLLSPLCITSPTQPYASPEERNSWSGGMMASFGSKSRSSTLDRSSSLRNTHSSRRSTNSSGKSPASMFLSMWSGQSQTDEPEPPSTPDEEGQLVGTDYVLGKQIGFGGFSTVKEAFKVEGQGNTKRLAVKIVKKLVSGRTESENEDVQAEFDHEVRVWRYLSNPHILTLDSVYETDYATFCFTKLAIGGTLFDLVRQNRQGLDTKLAKKYSYQLACAIRYLHQDARVVHRDIKLENCLLDPVDGSNTSNLVLCDFGMAEWMATDNGGDSPDPYDEVADRPPPNRIGPAGSSTSVAGSLEYAAPELIQSSAGVIHPSVDIWAFGVIVYTIVVGSRPFQDSFAPRIQANILSGKWNRDALLGELTSKLSRHDRQDALDLVQGCLEMDVNKRWTIRDVLDCAWLREVAQFNDSSPEAMWGL